VCVWLCVWVCVCVCVWCVRVFCVVRVCGKSAIGAQGENRVAVCIIWRCVLQCALQCVLHCVIDTMDA